MSEITIGTWNALNAFGDERLDADRFYAGLETIKRMDADVVALPETACRGVHHYDTEQAQLQRLGDHMVIQGYKGIITDYSPFSSERNAHYLSLWTRVGYFEGDITAYGRRNTVRVAIPEVGARVHGLHLDDRYPLERQRTVRELIATETHPDTALYASIIMGDINEMYRHDSKGRIPRLLGKAVNRFEVDFYDRTKRFQRVAGKVIRTCRMAGGEALELFEQAGYHDADPTMQPTIGRRGIAFQLDHILGSKDVAFEDFTVHDVRNVAGRPLSDHVPITARAVL